MDEPTYRETGRDGFTRRGSFILRKLNEHDPIRFKEVMDDLYRDEPPRPAAITKFQWQTILAYLGATDEEIKDVQARMGRQWR
jgi:hypothetical protein